MNTQLEEMVMNVGGDVGVRNGSNHKHFSDCSGSKL